MSTIRATTLFCSFEWRHDGCEIFREAARVLVKQLVNALKFRRADDEADVMPFLRAIDDLFIHVSGGVRVFLSRQRQDYASVTFARRGQLVRAIAAATTTARHLYPGPLAPEVDAARCSQSLRDIRAANS